MYAGVQVVDQWPIAASNTAGRTKRFVCIIVLEAREALMALQGVISLRTTLERIIHCTQYINSANNHYKKNQHLKVSKAWLKASLEKHFLKLDEGATLLQEAQPLE